MVMTAGHPVGSAQDQALWREGLFVAALLDTLRHRGFVPETTALDMGYDNNRVYAESEERDVAPVIPLRQTPEVKRGNRGAPTCEHGTWTCAFTPASSGAGGRSVVAVA